ncbi:L-histidine N(alpha)-methyltransferase [Nocardioides sambongensis]|uniref:L-histidine N(alpha)-methyltransferase n=1 Tax=Nocardioides sambongensis TaxID=2589074 RepID=UPI001125B55E|nr:L-histidine N(alpha)-methyltransferase [Nocardioides sambongensis]
MNARIRTPHLAVLLEPDWAAEALVTDVRRGLGTVPRSLPPKWLYDERGSQLFDRITRLPEYYPTEAERSILAERADAVAALSGARTLVELGSGTSDKTRLLLDALTGAGQLDRFVPVDVSAEILTEAAEQIAQRYPGVGVDAVVGDFTLHLSHLTRYPNKLVAFLGGTLGNLYLEERAAFLGALSDALSPGDHLLLGTDLVKEADRLISAYDDSAGVTEEFVKNALLVLNAQLGGDFDPDAFGYVPFWDSRMRRMDLRLRAEVPQRVRLPGADLELDLAAGEEIRIEISTKFTPDQIAAELGSVDLGVVEQWTDPAGDFALTLARRH